MTGVLLDAVIDQSSDNIDMVMTKLLQNCITVRGEVNNMVSLKKFCGATISYYHQVIFKSRLYITAHLVGFGSFVYIYEMQVERSCC